MGFGFNPNQKFCLNFKCVVRDDVCPLRQEVVQLQVSTSAVSDMASHGVSEDDAAAAGRFNRCRFLFEPPLYFAVMDMSDDSGRLYAAMENMMMQQTTLIDQNHALAAQNASLLTHTAELTSRIVALEEAVSTKATVIGAHIGALGEIQWKCPVCGEVFKHRESFKGHIRRLAHPVSAGAKCFLDSEKHRALLENPRYGEGDLESRKAQFVMQLYDMVKSASSSRHTSESSHRQVRAAIAA
jgi:uncharacterized C2H2 Zn-finger protein